METVNFGNQENPAPKAPKNRKLIWAGIVLAFFVAAVLGWQWWQYVQSPYYQQLKAAKQLEKAFSEDKTGGKTPEETLALFTDAVVSEDFELASQYVIYGRQESVKESLIKIKNNGRLQFLIDDLKIAKKIMTPDFGDNSLDFIKEVNGVKQYTILSMDKNQNNIWKIIEF